DSAAAHDRQGRSAGSDYGRLDRAASQRNLSPVCNRRQVCDQSGRKGGHQGRSQGGREKRRKVATGSRRRPPTPPQACPEVEQIRRRPRPAVRWIDLGDISVHAFEAPGLRFAEYQ
ncbi:hypothetical protein BCR44DRAFT_1516358, partial [Catenaria anguillulae PL171]